MADEVSIMPKIHDYNIVTSKQGRENSGVSSFDYVDAYNSSQLAQYNNDYQYWLWQQEQEYNSPTAQVERLKAAGLNPNANSIDGTGNVNFKGSNQSMAENIGSNHWQRKNFELQVGVQSVNQILDAVSQGVDLTSKISGIPNNISGYRQLLYDNKFYDTQGKRIGNEMKNILGSLEQYRAYGIDSESPVLDSPYTFAPIVAGAPGHTATEQNAEQAELRTQIMQAQQTWDSWTAEQKTQFLNAYYDHMSKMYPALENAANATAQQAQNVANITGKQDDFFYANQGMNMLMMLLGAMSKF